MAAAKTSKSGSLASLVRDAGKTAKASVEGQDRKDGSSAEVEIPKGMVIIPPLAHAPRIFNVLDYIESSWGLQLDLFPVQRFIVKLYYHIPLDSKNKTIQITDMFGCEVLYRFTETEYLRYLFDQGRCNISEQDHDRRELILAIGRRSGKSTLAGIFASYEVYRLLNLQNPQEFYGLPPGNRIQIISIGTDKDQAGILFNEVTSHLNRCEYFSPYIANNTQSLIQFRTPADIEKFGANIRYENGKFTSFEGKATLRVTFKSCIAKGLRGFGNIVVILDEMAHFQDKGQSSADDIYKAITPSTAAFAPKDPKTGLPVYGADTHTDARIICISSPLNRQGKFYDLYHQAMSRGEGSENLLAIQAPTWEVNPTVPTTVFRQAYHSDTVSFMTEFGAQFSDRVRGWIEREKDLLDCIDPNHRPIMAGIPRSPHQMGIDVGLIKDGTSIFITHVENDIIVVDYHETWSAGVEWKVSNPHLLQYPTPYARELAKVDRLDFDAIAEWIHALSRRFYISEGMFDQQHGQPLEQHLKKMGLGQFTAEHFTADLGSRIYQNTKLQMYDRRLKLYDFPKDGHRHSPFIQELLSLQAEQRTRNIISVSAPQTAGSHDDMSDAFTRAVWLSTQRLSKSRLILGPTESRATTGSGMSLARYQASRARYHGGFSERMVPKRIGLRMRSR